MSSVPPAPIPPHVTCIDVSAPFEVERFECGADCPAPQPQGGLEAAYRRGFQDGYEQAEAAANRSWRGQEKVFQGGAWLSGPTAAERKAERVAVLVEAHAAGLHVGLHAVDCPECMTDAQSRLQHNRHYDVFVCKSGDRCIPCTQRVLAGGKPLPEHVQHKPDYGVGCSCACLGVGTPEHAPGPLCLPMTIRPAGDV